MTQNVRSRGTRNAGNDLVNDFRAAGQEKEPLINFSFVVTVLCLFGVGFAAALVFTLEIGPAERPSETALFAFKQMVAEEPEPVARSYNVTGKLMPFSNIPTYANYSFHKTETGLDPIDSEIHERCLKRIDTQASRWAEKYGKTSLDFWDSEKFLICSMRVQKSRFCDGYYRRRLANRIREHMSAHAKTMKGLGMMFAMATDNADDAIRAMRGMAKLSGHKIKTPPKNPITNNMGHHLASLSQMGLLRSKDFGGVVGGAPEVIEQYLSNVASPCS